MSIIHFFVRHKIKLILAGVALGAVAYWVYSTKLTNTTPTFTIVAPEIRDITQSLTISGSIQASQSANLFFPGSSRLSWVGVKPGDAINKWQAIASIDTRTLQKQLQQQLNLFEKQFRAHDQVLDDNNFYGSPDINQELRRILENAQFDLNNSVIAVEIQDLAIRLSTLVAPFDGIITNIANPNVGSNIGPTQTFDIINPSSVYFSIVADEEDVSLISLGQTSRIYLDAFPNLIIDSTVTYVDFTPSFADGGGTGYQIELSLPVDNTELSYRIGMNGEADIILAQKTAVLTIPTDAVITRDNVDYVEILDQDGQPQRQTVTLGVSDEAYVEILSGLSGNEHVVVPSNEIK